ncbi:hypothetical protein BAJUN_02730 [Bajunvirus bajun]|uniref:Uncharacterized protein n=1 Tax=Brevundimonas phage vB_BgoS-Bajun TaxID=2948594 RepID=A0A9E7N7N8_9CAUD|nr:hypothetical protein BAJUN_02730 [Brevundimonas phage vB_BgoS-Bajun]
MKTLEALRCGYANACTSAAHTITTPLAGVIFAGFSIGWMTWALLNHAVIGWDGVATIASLAFVVILQASQNTDSKGLHAKLDAIIAALPEADDRFKRIEERTEEEIEQARLAAT